MSYINQSCFFILINLFNFFSFSEVSEKHLHSAVADVAGAEPETESIAQYAAAAEDMVT